MRFFLFLLLLSSCGKGEEKDTSRCYSREEAIMACTTKVMADKGLTADYAEIICRPYFPYQYCYNLEDILNGKYL